MVEEGRFDMRLGMVREEAFIQEEAREEALNVHRVSTRGSQFWTPTW